MFFFEDQFGPQDPANLADLPPLPDGGTVKKSLKVSIVVANNKFFVHTNKH